MLLIMSLTQAGLAQSRASNTQELKHGDWHSMLFKTDEALITRAFTIQIDDNGEFSTFNIDSPGIDCDIVLYSINVNLSEIQQTTSESPILFGKFRVDREVVHNITYTLSVREGNDYITIWIKDWSAEASVLKEIMSGNTARFELMVDDNPFYFRFSLKGSRSAMERQDNLCRKNSGDEQYFQDDNQDSDADFFRT